LPARPPRFAGAAARRAEAPSATVEAIADIVSRVGV
jgi:hypothetical protein